MNGLVNGSTFYSPLLTRIKTNRSPSKSMYTYGKWKRPRKIELRAFFFRFLGTWNFPTGCDAIFVTRAHFERKISERSCLTTEGTHSAVHGLVHNPIFTRGLLGLRLLAKVMCTQLVQTVTLLWVAFELAQGIRWIAKRDLGQVCREKSHNQSSQRSVISAVIINTGQSERGHADILAMGCSIRAIRG